MLSVASLYHSTCYSLRSLRTSGVSVTATCFRSRRNPSANRVRNPLLVVAMRRPSTTSTSTRRQSIVEAAEQHFDKNTIILVVNVVILMVLMGILYMIATSAMNVSGKLHHEEN